MANQPDQHNRGGMIAFIFSMVFVFLFFFYIVVIHPGVDLDQNVVDPHAQGEKTGPAFDIDKVAEPWVSTPELVAYGQKQFMINCSTCHGPKGMGDGPAGAGLNPHPRNFVEGKWTQGPGMINHFKVIQNGIQGSSMASFKHLKKADRWAILNFIESITQNKSQDSADALATFAKSAE